MLPCPDGTVIIVQVHDNASDTHCDFCVEDAGGPGDACEDQPPINCEYEFSMSTNCDGHRDNGTANTTVTPRNHTGNCGG